MRIALVSMPWNLLETPSLPLAILKSCIVERRPEHAVAEFYANLSWAEYLNRETGGEVSVSDYDYVANVGCWHGMGDWIFAPALYDTPGWRADVYLSYLAERGIDPRSSQRMAALSAGFTAWLARAIADVEPDVVGFSSTFQQNVPSLAVARRLKQIAPRIHVVFGGGNCDIPMGPALHRNFPFVDYVISGEAEHSFPAFLDYLADGGAVAQVPGLSWRDSSGITHTNSGGPMVSMGDSPCPDYDGWETALSRSALRERISPVLLYESARGCWWGEKHTCTFCGLNGLTMKFRSRDPAEVVKHITGLVTRYRILDVACVDNILDLKYLRSALPAFAELDWDLHLYYETKANLREQDLAMMRAGGLVQIQPGIENLSTAVLKLMRKGVHATHNVRLLRDCEDCDMTVDWNYLYGFPGEREEDYISVLDQMPALVHLQPPYGHARIQLERYSPYFDDPALGFVRRRPSPLYNHVYDLPSGELGELAYQFWSEPQGIQGATLERLAQAVRTWKSGYSSSWLTCHAEADGALVVKDRRAGWDPRDIRIPSGPPADLYTALRHPRTPQALREMAGDADLAQRWCRQWRAEGLIFEDGGRLVALATQRANLKDGAADRVY